MKSHCNEIYFYYRIPDKYDSYSLKVYLCVDKEVTIKIQPLKKNGYNQYITDIDNCFLFDIFAFLSKNKIATYVPQSKADVIDWASICDCGIIM